MSRIRGELRSVINTAVHHRVRLGAVRAGAGGHYLQGHQENNMLQHDATAHLYRHRSGTNLPVIGDFVKHIEDSWMCDFFVCES